MSPLLTTKEAAALLGISPRFLSRERAAGRIAWVALGSRVLFRLEALEAYARSNELKGMERQGTLPRAATSSLGSGFDLAALERSIPKRRSRTPA